MLKHQKVSKYYETDCRFPEWANPDNRNLRINSWVSLFSSMMLCFGVGLNFSLLPNEVICFSVGGLVERLIIFRVTVTLSSRFYLGLRIKNVDSHWYHDLVLEYQVQ